VAFHHPINAAIPKITQWADIAVEILIHDRGN